MASLQLCLQSGEILRPRLQSHMRVLKGRLWLTRSGDQDDHFMQIGDDAQLKPNESPLVEAVNGSALISLEMTNTANRLY